MKFFDQPTIYGCFQKYGIHHAHRMDTEAWLREVLPTNPNRIERQHLETECRWLLDRRPYYSVYPAIAEALARVTLDVDCSFVKLPLPRLVVRFSEEHPLPVGDLGLRSFLAFALHDGKDPGLGLLANFGEEVQGRPSVSHGAFALPPGTTVESQIAPEIIVGGNTVIHGHTLLSLLEPCMRIVVALCLMQNDPDMVVPDVLSVDATKYELDPDQKYVDRAHRRGKIGWLVGARIEVDPHYRRPHFGVRWTGTGRHVPRVVPIKGCIVKRSRLTKIPTGYLDDDENDSHP